jgi:threonine dehydrogenase-like Zn-dependent dehydrogenase
MQRRDFLAAGAGALALSSMPGYFVAAADEKPKRVGLIGCGWYGQCDLLRLVQVSPVEVVSLCDVDKKMLAEAADLVATRQAPSASRARSATIARCSRRKTWTSCWSLRPTIGTRCP